MPPKRGRGRGGDGASSSGASSSGGGGRGGQGAQGRGRGRGRGAGRGEAKGRGAPSAGPPQEMTFTAPAVEHQAGWAQGPAPPQRGAWGVGGSGPPPMHPAPLVPAVGVAPPPTKGAPGPSSISSRPSSYPSTTDTFMGETSSAAAGSSASSGSSSSRELMRTNMGLDIVPGELKLGSFPRRPDRGGSMGRRMVIRVNHFSVLLRPSTDLCQYDVTVTPETNRRAVNRAVINEVVRLYRQPQASGPHLGGRLPAYDGMKNLYTSGLLPGGENGPPLVFDNIIPLEEGEKTPKSAEESSRRQRSFRVVIKFATHVNLVALGEFLAGRFAEQPQDAINALDIVLREPAVNKYIPVGRSFFSPGFGRPLPLGGGVQAVRGFFQSLRPSQAAAGVDQSRGINGLTLNVDMANTTFVEPKAVHLFAADFIRRPPGQPVSDADRRQLVKVLRNVRVEAMHQPYKRRYRIRGLTSQPARQLRFDVDNEEEGRPSSVSLMAYFRNKYAYEIKFPDLPCLECGSNPQKPIWLPMEVCHIVEGQRYARKLTPQQTSSMLTAAKQFPNVRRDDIMARVQENNYSQDAYSVEFGIRVNPVMIEVQARVLDTPMLKYHDQGRNRETKPRDGAWNMRDTRVVDGGTVHRWACINFASGGGRDGVPPPAADRFCTELARMCNVTGLRMAQMVMPVQNCQPFPPQVEAKIREVYEMARRDTQPNQQPLDILLCILPTTNTIYGDVKRVSELEIGVVTQCVLSKHIAKCSPQYLANVALKINPKVGGRNMWLVEAKARRLPVASKEPTILFGADVTHPGVGDDSSPSIAAVVANQDWPEMCTYRGLVRSQPAKREMIEELHCEPRRGVGPPVREGMVTELLRAFQEHSRCLPQRLIFFRDGVSEGQFDTVRDLEVHAVRKACGVIDPGYKPKITFISVQKRHHTRLFPTSQQGADRSGNVLPGTVVDSQICHPIQYDFFLCSHAGLQGVSRPAKYVVLWDENAIPSNELQHLINSLCYTYASCTRSVSVVPPAYYAHKLAFRARFYLPMDVSDSGSQRSGQAGGARGGESAGGASSSSRSSRDPSEAQNYPIIPEIRANVKNVMFYC